MKKKIASILVLLLVAAGAAWAGDRVVIAQPANGSVVAGEVEGSGEATVTLTVAPAPGYYVTAQDITVARTAATAMARRAPGYAGGITVSEVSVDATGRGTYAFTLPEDYGAYVEAAFTPCMAISPAVSMADWSYGLPPATPAVTGNPGGGEVTFTYAAKGTDDFTAEVPSYVGDYVVKASIAAAGHYLAGEATAAFSILLDVFDLEAVDEETDSEVDDVKLRMEVSDPAAKTITIAGIIVPEALEGDRLGIYIPESVGEYKVTGLASGLADGHGNVTDVYLPQTEEPIAIGEGALPATATVHTPLELLDDYALTASLQANYEAVKVSATVTPRNRLCTFSSGVDCVLPEGVTAYKVYLTDGMQPRIVALEEAELRLADGRRGVRANNGVLISCDSGRGGSALEIVASPGNQQSGARPATTDARSYDGNQLEPVVERKNYPAGEYLVLKDNRFHSIADNGSKVGACKAVLRIKK